MIEKKKLTLSALFLWEAG